MRDACDYRVGAHWEISGNSCLSSFIYHTMQTRSSSGDDVPAPASIPSKPYAHWTDNDDTTLVSALSAHADAMTAGAMFRKEFFQIAATALQHKGPSKRGAEKNWESCKFRWQKVCISFIRVLPIF